MNQNAAVLKEKFEEWQKAMGGAVAVVNHLPKLVEDIFRRHHPELCNKPIELGNLIKSCHPCGMVMTAALSMKDDIKTAGRVVTDITMCATPLWAVFQDEKPIA